jgi:hypothetical protein
MRGFSREYAQMPNPNAPFAPSAVLRSAIFVNYSIPCILLYQKCLAKVTRDLNPNSPPILRNQADTHLASCLLIGN